MIWSLRDEIGFGLGIWSALSVAALGTGLVLMGLRAGAAVFAVLVGSLTLSLTMVRCCPQFLECCAAFKTTAKRHLYGERKRFFVVRRRPFRKEVPLAPAPSKSHPLRPVEGIDFDGEGAAPAPEIEQTSSVEPEEDVPEAELIQFPEPEHEGSERIPRNAAPDVLHLYAAVQPHEEK